MGAIISRLRQSNDSDYEKILSDLDSNIRKAEMRLSAINLREKRMLGLWLIYSVLSWIGYTAVFALYLNEQYYNDPQRWAIALAAVVLGLPVIYVGRSAIAVWYKRAKSNEESQLSLLRADQRLKVEELKKKTAYYSTKTLLERYDPSSQQQRSNGARPVGPDGRPNSAQQNGQPRPQQPNMMDPGLRQRQGQGVINGLNPANQGRPMSASSGMQPQPSHVGQGPHGQSNAHRGPQLMPYGPGQANHAMPPRYGPPSNERHWYDKIVDVIVGEEGPDTKYALICGQCFAHNGLALPQEIEDIQYVCPKCNFFNPSRRKTRMAAAGIRSPSPSPDSVLLRAQEKPLPVSREPSPSPSPHRSPRPDHDGSPSLNDHQHQHHHHHHHQQDGPGLSDGASPEPVSDAVPVGEHSESDDTEFVNNWHDSDAEGVHHDEQSEDEGSDDGQGYKVGSEDVAESKPTKSASKTKAAGEKKKSKRA